MGFINAAFQNCCVDRRPLSIRPRHLQMRLKKNRRKPIFSKFDIVRFVAQRSTNRCKDNPESRREGSNNSRAYPVLEVSAGGCCYLHAHTIAAVCLRCKPLVYAATDMFFIMHHLKNYSCKDKYAFHPSPESGRCAKCVLYVLIL